MAAARAAGDEIADVPALLRLLNRAGASVTVDAMHRRRATAEAIVSDGGNYVMALKTNQSALHDEVMNEAQNRDKVTTDLFTDVSRGTDKNL